MTDDTISTLVASSTRGRYALDDPDTGHDLTSGESIAIRLGGQWTPGHIEHSRGRYESRAPGLPTHLTWLLLHCQERWRGLRPLYWNARPTDLNKEETMPDPLETTVFTALREALGGDTRLSRRFSLREPTKKLARMLAGSGASLIETPFSSIGMPQGLSSHCSREISGAQVTTKGDSHYATPSLPR